VQERPGPVVTVEVGAAGPSCGVLARPSTTPKLRSKTGSRHASEASPASRVWRRSRTTWATPHRFGPTGVRWTFHASRRSLPPSWTRFSSDLPSGAGTSSILRGLRLRGGCDEPRISATRRSTCQSVILGSTPCRSQVFTTQALTSSGVGGSRLGPIGHLRRRSQPPAGMIGAAGKVSLGSDRRPFRAGH